MKKVIHTEKAPQAIGPYSQAIQVGDMIYISGQIGMDPETGDVQEGIQKQTKQVMENLGEILKEAGADFSHLVKTTIYLASMDDFSEVNDIYGSYVEEPYPARATIEVSRLPKDVLVEIDAIVYRPL